ncbi:HEAT repeat domain-containing protein [Streptomyces bikiniensis]|uniref:HEAT repeat domain-containing protein n=1 Tax=Streptomyces bikiniensis TaxID=1896 RepID=UPI000689BA6A|nr:HEAT repeat domain-containing protein [Streptomyces bikiniensis]
MDMDGYARLTARIEKAWEKFDDPATPHRDFRLDEISDVLEAGLLTQEDAERAVGRMVGVALSGDEDRAVLESALYAVCTAGTRYTLPLPLVKPLADAADRFDPPLLAYVLSALGSTYDKAATPLAERFLDHPHPEIRREAEDALTEIRWRYRHEPIGGALPDALG